MLNWCNIHFRIELIAYGPQHVQFGFFLAPIRRVGAVPHILTPDQSNSDRSYLGTDEKHENTEAVFSVFFVICRVFRVFLRNPRFCQNCRDFLLI
jgi:hypothetical protein